MGFWFTATLVVAAAFLTERFTHWLVDPTSKGQAILALCGMFVGLACCLWGVAQGYRYGLNYGDRRLAYFAASLIGALVGLIVGKVLRV
jgi:hypothetical protein